MNEFIVRFGENRALTGIFSVPESVQKLPAVIFLNAGTRHRIGPNRIYTLLARKLANRGFTGLRFDFSGSGDSCIVNNTRPFRESAAEEIRDAMRLLRQKTGLDEFILLGICSGADLAWEICVHEKSIKGLVLINGFLVHAQELEDLYPAAEEMINARYYKKKILQPANWIRFFSGRSNYINIFKSLIKKTAKKQEIYRTPEHSENYGIWNKIIEKQIPVLLLYAEGSIGLDFFNLTARNFLEPNIRNRILDLKIIPDCDHVFSFAWAREMCMQEAAEWLSMKFTKGALLREQN